jgi:hypothetical protein
MAMMIEQVRAVIWRVDHTMLNTSNGVNPLTPVDGDEDGDDDGITIPSSSSGHGVQIGPAISYVASLAMT